MDPDHRVITRADCIWKWGNIQIAQFKSLSLHSQNPLYAEQLSNVSARHMKSDQSINTLSCIMLSNLRDPRQTIGSSEQDIHQVEAPVVPHKKFKNTTVVPAMNGDPRDQAKVSVHDRWPLVRGMEGRVGGGAKCNTGYSLHENIMHHHQRYSY